MRLKMIDSPRAGRRHRHGATRDEAAPVSNICTAELKKLGSSAHLSRVGSVEVKDFGVEDDKRVLVVGTELQICERSLATHQYWDHIPRVSGNERGWKSRR